MKKLLLIFSTILLMSTTWLNAQDSSPLPNANIKKLVAPNAPINYFNTIDNGFWTFMGQYGWKRLAGWTEVKDTLINYWNKQEITEADTTRWGSGGTLIDSIGNAGYFTNYKALSKEDRSNKENTTVDNSTTKYPTVNLLKTYADTKDPSSANELNSSVSFNHTTKVLTVVDAGGSKTATIDLSVGNVVNSYSNLIQVTSQSVSVNWPILMKSSNYFLNIRAWYPKIISGKSIQVQNAVYNYSKTVNGFTLSVDTIAGYLEYFAADTTNLLTSVTANVVVKNDSTMVFVTPAQLKAKNYLTVTGSAAQLTNFPTFNQNTTGTASNVSGIVLGVNGGTGVANSGKTITLGGNLVTSGAFSTTFTVSGATNVTLPTSGTLMKAVLDDTSPTLGGNLVVNQKNIDVSSTLSTNSSYSGIVEIGTVGENVVFGEILYLKFSDGKWWKAKADTYSTTPGMRMSMATIAANASGVLLVEGNVRYDSWSLAANKVYLSAATAGAITTTQPATTGNQIQVLGIAKTATKLYFKPSQDVGEK